MPTLAEKVKEFAKYEAGRPMLKDMQRHFTQMRERWTERKYLRAAVDAGSTSIDALGMGVWQVLNGVEILSLISIPPSLYSGDWETAGSGAAAIVLAELVKFMIAKPDVYLPYVLPSSYLKYPRL